MIKVAIIGLGKAAMDIHLPACQMLDEVQGRPFAHENGGRRTGDTRRSLARLEAIPVRDETVDENALVYAGKEGFQDGQASHDAAAASHDLALCVGVG